MRREANRHRTDVLLRVSLVHRRYPVRLAAAMGIYFEGDS